MTMIFIRFIAMLIRIIMPSITMVIRQIHFLKIILFDFSSILIVLMVRSPDQPD